MMKKVVLFCLFSMPITTLAQVSTLCSGNMYSPNAPNQPAAFYIGDSMTLAIASTSSVVVTPALFTHIRPGTSSVIASGSQGTATLVLPGQNTINAFVIDSSNQASQCDLNAQVFYDLTASIASITGSLVYVNPIAFAGTTTGGGGGNSYLWEFGDGETASTLSATHEYNDAGSFTVRFTATDQYGRTKSVTQSLTIGVNTAVPGKPSNLRQEKISCGGSTTSYVFDWNGNGSQPSNYFKFQIKPLNSSNWGYVYTGTDPSRVMSGLLEDFNYSWRVKGCTSTDDSSCGPTAQKNVSTDDCSGGGAPL